MHLQIRKVLLNQQNIVFGEVLICLCLILVNCHILSNVNYLINIVVLSMDHRCLRLITSNCIVKIITEISICNPMSWSGDNYRKLLDGQGTLNLEPLLLSWKYNLTNLRSDMYTFKELIDIRDGITECNGFTKAEISRFFKYLYPLVRY